MSDALRQCPRVAARIRANIEFFTIAVNPVTNRVYATGAGSTGITVISGQTNTIIATIATPGPPGALAVNRKTGRIYVVGGPSTVWVLSGRTNKLTATITVGRGAGRPAVNPATDTIYVPNQFDGTLSVINGHTNKVTATIPAGTNPFDVAVNPRNDTVYVSDNAQEGLSSVSVINGRTGTITATIPVSGSLPVLAVNPLTNTLYVVTSDNMVLVINGHTHKITASIPVGAGPHGIALDRVASTLYVTNPGRVPPPSTLTNTVSVISTKTNSVRSVVHAGLRPFPIAANPRTHAAYTGDTGSGSITVLTPCPTLTSRPARANTVAATTLRIWRSQAQAG